MAIDRLQKKTGVGRHLSAVKRARQIKRRRLRNKRYLSAMKSAVKDVRKSRSAGDLAKAVPFIAKIARKGVIHPRKASRLISRLTRAVNAKQA